MRKRREEKKKLIHTDKQTDRQTDRQKRIEQNQFEIKQNRIQCRTNQLYR